MKRFGRKAVVGSAAALLLAAAAGLFFAESRKPGERRPKYIFLNETGNHAYDTALKMSLKLAEKRSGIENALVLLEKLPPSSTIEEVAEELFQRFRIGQDRGGRGILFVHSEEENLFKIEVSYELEAIFPDVLCHRLEEAARTYLLSEIPQDFLSELIITMNIEGRERREASLDWSAPAWMGFRFVSGGAGVKAKGYRRTLEDYLAAIRELPLEQAVALRPSADPSESVSLYLDSLERGLGDPHLPFLTEGSQVFRMVVPRSPAQQRRVLDYYRRATPFEIHIRGELGLVVFRPGVANLPIVLRRSRNGLWYVDEPKSWTYFHRWEDGTDFFPKYDDLPLLSALREAKHPHAERSIYRGRVATPKPIPHPFSLAQAVRELQDRIRRDERNPEWHARLGEVYLFEINWISRAIECFETAARLAPDRTDYRWRLYDLYINHSEVEKALAQLRFLSERLPEDAELQDWLKSYTAAYRFDPGEFS
jgi:tetratricopeptide (TPR) repeat protein